MFRFFMPALVVVTLFLGAPRQASACIWNWQHRFAPAPPCDVRDHPTINRIKQGNARIMAALVNISAKIQTVRIEVEQWRYAYHNARLFEDQLRRVWGDVTANPLPSLVAAYEHMPISGYIELNHDGGFGLSAGLVDFRGAADSVWNALQDQLSIESMYKNTFLPSGQHMLGELYGTAGALEREILELGKFERWMNPVLDSIRALGQRTADRYTGRADLDGSAEAQISSLSASLSRLKGTIFEAQTLGISARIQALEEATLLHHEERRFAPVEAVYIIGF